MGITAEAAVSIGAHQYSNRAPAAPAGEGACYSAARMTAASSPDARGTRGRRAACSPLMVLWALALPLTPLAAAAGGWPSTGAAAVYAAGSLVCHQRPERSFSASGHRLAGLRALHRDLPRGRDRGRAGARRRRLDAACAGADRGAPAPPARRGGRADRGDLGPRACRRGDAVERDPRRVRRAARRHRRRRGRCRLWAVRTVGPET